MIGYPILVDSKQHLFDLHRILVLMVKEFRCKDKRSMVKVAEKTASLNYPNPHIKVDTYGSKYTGEQYHRDFINIENKTYGKIANHIHNSSVFFFWMILFYVIKII